MVVRFRSAMMIYWFCIRLTSKRWGFNVIQEIVKYSFICCHLGIHVDVTSILHSLTLLVP